MAALEGAKVLRLQRGAASPEACKKAEIILIELSKPHLKPVCDICADLFYPASGSDVDTVVLHGKILMQNRRI